MEQGRTLLIGSTSKHTGIDISGKHHDSVMTIEDGLVKFAGVQQGFGNCILIQHNNPGETTFYTFYAHLSKIDVIKDQFVIRHQVIGNEGGDPKTDPNPGYSTGHHLHFEVRTTPDFGSDVNPNTKIRI
ncbi:MAG: M23 family metallopeptidase [Clostridia bacterium]